MAVLPIFCLFMSVNILGLNTFALTPNGATHKEVDVEKPHLADFGELTGDFKQIKLLHDLDIEIKTEGNFKVIKANKTSKVFYWNIEKPQASHICIDKDGLMIENLSSKKKKYLKFSEVGRDVGDQITSLLKIIMMDQEDIEHEFDIKKQNDKLLLTPLKKENAFFASALLKINKLGLVESVAIKEKSQDEINIQFSKLVKKDFQILKDLQCAH